LPTERHQKGKLWKGRKTQNRKKCKKAARPLMNKGTAVKMQKRGEWGREKKHKKGHIKRKLGMKTRHAKKIRTRGDRRQWENNRYQKAQKREKRCLRARGGKMH